MKTWLTTVMVAAVLVSGATQVMAGSGADAATAGPLCEACDHAGGEHAAHCDRHETAGQPAKSSTPATGGDFTLASATGPVNLVDLRGQVVLIYFGYTSCPDICPTNLAMIASALKSLAPEELARVRVLFVSVDPERDDLQRLTRYAAYFHPNILGLTGTPNQLAKAATAYGVVYRRVDEPGSALGYMMDHSADTYVVDRQGHLARTFHHATPSSQILAVIRELLG
ncbi:SCO family protein [uncultured Thiodictyon sp.]|uniref:SCO family protein n=1 Tax=uncultured Thiodictyon sp. TaxID=1846217 RepID=UPI0025ED70B3|nr:SCO family protein [uncultured Thiodictyon sp.]